MYVSGRMCVCGGLYVNVCVNVCVCECECVCVCVCVCVLVSVLAGMWLYMHVCPIYSAFSLAQDQKSI